MIKKIRTRLSGLILLLVISVALGSAYAEEFPVPNGFELQVMEPLGGKIARPKGWFYRERHGEKHLRWIISKEDPDLGAYETGMSIQFFPSIEESGKTPEEFVKSVAEGIAMNADKATMCGEQKQQFFTRICVETIETQHREDGDFKFHILYSLFWGHDTLDSVGVVIAGTTPEKWEQYKNTFNAMNKIQLIDMTRFTDKTESGEK